MSLDVAACRTEAFRLAMAKRQRSGLPGAAALECRWPHTTEPPDRNAIGGRSTDRHAWGAKGGRSVDGVPYCGCPVCGP